MASVLLSPVGNGVTFFNNNGIPLSGGTITTYQAGSSTLLATYTTIAGTIANSNPIVLGTNGISPNEIWLQTGYSYKFVIADSSGNTIQTLDNLYPIAQASSSASVTIPSGLIAIWSGSTGSIPSGWYLCNGSNGTPDLRNSFILGAGNSYSVGQTGGSTSATLTQANLPNVNFTVTDPGHKHNVASTGASSTLINASAGLTTGSSSVTTDTATTGITVNSGGSATAVSTLPPYYALAYIQKA